MTKEYEFLVTVTVEEVHYIEAKDYKEAEELFLSGIDRHIDVVYEKPDNWECIEGKEDDNESN